MTPRIADPVSSSQIAIVVIGRNEGEILKRALVSVVSDDCIKVVYVDSGSTDGSIELARSMSVEVHALDAVMPFSAARARREGVEVLLVRHPGIVLVQFLDGDCELVEGWIAQAAGYLKEHGDVAIVCGKLAEKYPDTSIYNRMSALQWNAQTGDIEACGGIFMIRLSAYKAAGGFNDLLLTGEEEELCRRIRRAGHRIVRIETPMAVHDSGLTRFSQWWARAVWGGYGDAIKFSMVPGALAHRLQHLHKRLFWPVAAPVIAIGGGIAMVWSLWFMLVPLSCLAAYGVLFVRIALDRLRRGDSARDAMLYSFLIIIRKFPAACGFMLYFIQRGERSKRPDPHAAGSSLTASRQAPAAGRPE